MSSLGYVLTNQVALLNNTQVASLAITQPVTQIITSTGGANSCILPANPKGGDTYTILVDSHVGNQVNVFPPVGGQINTLTANTAVAILAGGSVSFLAIPSAITGFATTNSSGQYLTIVNQSVGAGFATLPVVPFVGAGGLLASQSGSLVTISNAAAYTITLPTPVGNAGVNFRFLQITAAAANTVLIDSSGAGLLNGTWTNSLTGGAVAGAVTAAGGNRSLSFLTAASLRGDTAFFISDGVKWNVQATTGAAAGMAFA